MKPVLLKSAALAAILLAAGCSSNGDNQAVADNGADNALAFNDTAPGDNVADAAPTIAPPPAAPAGTPADDAAPLTQAAQIASEIGSAADVERVPYQGGWAWRRSGQILRTSSRDGRISYFRPGESTPFFVQQGEQSFAYAGGRPRRAYDRSGHAAPLAPDRQGEAQRLADQSRQDHSQAAHAPAPQPDQGHDRANGPGHPAGDRAGPPQAPPSGNAADNAHGGGHDRNAGADRGRDRSDEESNRMGRRDH